MFNPTVKPDSPHNLLKISTTSRTLTISWSAGFDGNSEIISYTVNIRQDNQNFGDASCQGSSSINSCIVPGLVTNATLKHLRPFTTYYLRVFAVNKIGKSEASEVVNATTAEDGMYLRTKTSAFTFVAILQLSNAAIFTVPTNACK